MRCSHPLAWQERCQIATIFLTATIVFGRCYHHEIARSNRAGLSTQRVAKATVSLYGGWVDAYLRFIHARDGRWRHLAELGTADVEAYLNHLVGDRHLSASSQNQCLNALVFLYRHVLEGVIPQDHLGKFVLLRSARPKRRPTVLSVDEGRRTSRLPDSV